MYRILWEHIGKKMPKGRGGGSRLDPLSLPTELQTALEALYGHYEKTFRLWETAGIGVPPCFIVVCNNIATSKLVRDYIAGFRRDAGDGNETFHNGRLELFRNFDESGKPLSLPRTLLINSEELESGEALDKSFRAAAADEIERFRREIVERTGDRQQAEQLTDHDLLREVMNTVGKAGRLGGGIPLRGLGGDAHRGLGRQHRHPCAGPARLRHPTALRTGDWPLPTPAVLRAQRAGPVQRRIRRRVRHPLRLHRQAGGRPRRKSPPRPCR